MEYTDTENPDVNESRMIPLLSRWRAKYYELKSHEGFRRYFLNTGWMFSEKILRLVAGLFVGAYVARYLGPAQYGLLNYVISLVSLFSVVATLGLDNIIVRELVNDDSRLDRILSTGLTLRLVASSVVFAVLVGFVIATDTDPGTLTLALIIGAGMFFESFGIIDYFFQSRVWSKYAVWSQMISMIVVSVIRVVLVIQKAPLVWFAVSYSLDLFVLAIGLVSFYVKSQRNFFGFQFDASIGRGLIRDGWPLILSSLAVTVYMKISQVMIQWMLGSEASGNYGVAVRLCEAWNFIPIAICASVFPAILNAKQASEELYKSRLQRLYDLMVIISVGIAIPMTFLSGFIVRILFGEAYTDSAGIIVLYIWSSVFVFLGVANGKWIISENMQVFRMTMLCIAGAINIVGNYVLIHRIGIKGAAVSSLISYAFAGYFCFLFTKKTRPVFVAMSRSFNPLRLFKLKLH